MHSSVRFYGEPLVVFCEQTVRFGGGPGAIVHLYTVIDYKPHLVVNTFYKPI